VGKKTNENLMNSEKTSIFIYFLLKSKQDSFYIYYGNMYAPAALGQLKITKY